MPGTDVVLLIVAAAGWLALIVVLILLVLLTGRWKTAFAEREWTLAPTPALATVEASLEAHASHAAMLEESVRTSLEEARATREAFEILGRELDGKSAEIRDLRLGAEHHHRRALILSAIRALEVIGVDRDAGSDPDQTLRGLEVELSEALEDNHVEIHYPAVGERIPMRGVDAGASRLVTTADEALVGTIASVERPAYIVRGPGGDEETLKPAAVTVYVSERSGER